MIVFLIVLVGILMTVLLIPIHGYAGALVLAMEGIGFDIFWQWLRFKVLARKTKSGHDMRGMLLPGFITGFVLRIINLIAFLKLGSGWLSQSEFLCFALLLLTLPFWSKLVAYKFRNFKI